MLSMRFRHSSVGMSRTHDVLMVLISDGRLVGCFSTTLFFSSVQKVSIGLKSWLFPGHSNNLIFFVLRKSVTFFARWHGAPSCKNISQLCIAVCNSNFSFINSRYFLPFMVVPGSRKNRQAVPWVEIAPQIITLGGCFMVFCVKLSLYRVPGGLLKVLFLKANCWIVVSSENTTLDHCWLVQSLYFFANCKRFNFIAEVSLGFLAGFRDLRPNSSIKRRLMILLLILEPVSPRSARIFSAEHEGAFTTHLFIKISSRRVVFRGRPLLLLSEYNPQCLNLTTA